MDPVIVSIEKGVPLKDREKFIGKPVSEFTEQLNGKDLDAVVKIGFKRRKYVTIQPYFDQQFPL